MFHNYESRIDLVGEVAVLNITGETDLASAPDLRRDVDEAMQATSGGVVLDLTDLEFLDSTALGTLMAAAGRMMTEQRQLVLVVTRSKVLRVLTITGLLDFFSIVPTRDEALARLSPDRCEREEGVPCCSGSCS